MERDVMWVPWTDPGVERLHLQQQAQGIVIDSLVIGTTQQKPFRVGYVIHADSAWRVRECSVRLIDEEDQAITLRADGEGHWTDAAGHALPALDGCIDIDIAVTPFTNTLPIRRLSLTPGQSATLQIVYITAPKLQFKAVQQRYTCLDTHANGGLYRYESLASGFASELPVDGDGLILDYPNAWKRIGA